MATNFGRVRIYNEEEFPPHKAIRSFNHVVLKGLAAGSLLPQGLLPQNLAEW